MTDGHHVEYMPLDDIAPATRNPKAHDTAGIKRSITHHGVAELPLIDDRTGQLIAGHGRLDQLRAMRDNGDTPPAGVRVDDGVWLAPVLRGWSSRSDDDAEAYLIASNRLTEKGGWDDRELAEILADLADVNLLELAGYEADDLAALEAALETEQLPDAGRPDDDHVPAPPKDPISAFGDLWLLGPHRLLCGDSTNPDHLALVTDGVEPGIVYTDPPYGISIVNDSGKVGHAIGTPFGGSKKGSIGGSKPYGKTGGKVINTTEYLPVAGDDTTDAARDAFTLLTASYPKAAHVWWGGNHYAASAGLPDSSCWLVWDKATGDNTFADAELAWTNHTGAVRILQHMWNGMLRASERGKRVHPTQKPVALAEWAFSVVDKDASRRTVLDVFGGSGSTLIAAENTDRAAMVIEMEPSYVDVICRRYEELTGIKPVRANGEPCSFLDDLELVADQ